MFERERDYPTAFIRDIAPDAHAVAVRWVEDQAKVVGGMPLLYAPGRRNYGDNPLLSAFAKRYASRTWKSGWDAKWSSGPVLAAWPDQKHLGEIADSGGVRALCVLAWKDSDVAPWVAASGAINLEPSAEVVTVPELDPVVKCALQDLGHRVNHANCLAGSMDQADAKTWFRVLKQAGLATDPDALYAQALADGWPSRGAERLREMATKVAAGSSLRGWNDQRWANDVVARWRTESQDR